MIKGDTDGVRARFYKRVHLHVTDYVNDRRANDADGLISILVVADNPTRANQDGSEFESRNVPDEQECDRPFLYVE